MTHHGWQINLTSFNRSQIINDIGISLSDICKHSTLHITSVVKNNSLSYKSTILYTHSSIVFHTAIIMIKSTVKEIKSSNWDNLNHISHIFFLAYGICMKSRLRLIELYMYNKENESYNVWMFIHYQSWTLWKFESNKYQRNHTYGYIIKDILKL